ncbi:hypothetical protein HXX76_004836 [Chlamydomonas incerta]|uniref:dolichol kinase n=1 Tax=Chlamydomonas incerta TaxID=51695 RepID=A0A835W3R3_CHLIN|nr:hypothetical protein HXX76_004836 [Chlamydomonas incerta]|eukprot:KAG2439482.1 hypothetical protein HXX76_004836 [Chlamydomonas incerta]
MALLAFLASLLDRANPDWFKGHSWYTFRACGQAGLAQGLLALPSLATAIAVATRSWWWHQAARLLVASSFQALLWYAWTAAHPRHALPSPPEACNSNNSSSHNSNVDDTSNSSGGRSGGLRPLFGTRRGGGAAAAPLLTWLYLGAVGLGLLAAAGGALRHGAAPPPPSSPRLLLPGSVFGAPRDIAASAGALQAALLAATAPALDHLAADLPRSFTPGEAGVLLQALLALAAGAGAYLAGAARQGAAHLLWSPHVTQPDPGMHVPAFTMLVLFWVLVMAACTAAAMAPAAAAAPAAPGLGAGEAGGKAPDTAAGSASGGGGKGRGGVNSIRSSAGRAAAASGGAAAARVPAAPARAAPAAATDGAARLLRLAAAGGAALSFLMLLDLGLWVLGRFVAASSRPRLATLAYWFGCLAVTVPLMYAVSKASAAREQQQQQQAAAAARRDGEAKERQQAPGGQQRQQEAGPHAAGKPEAAGKGIANGGGAAASTSNSGGGLSGSSNSGSSGSGWLLRALAVPHIVMRKGYHLVAILLFAPAFGWDVRMLQASLAVAGAVLVFAELLRCCGPPALRRAIGGFMADFADARDSGRVYVTHFTLLLGIAVPVWLGESVCGAAAGAMMAGLYGPEAAAPMPLSAAAAAGAAAAPPPLRLSAAAARMLPSCRTLLGLSGLVSLGSGDTAAACVGFLLGRRRLFRGGKKTWEGTASGAAAMLASWRVVVWWMDVGWALGWGTWARLGGITAGVALLEAVTSQLDNVVVPLYYLTHLVLLATGN